MRNASVYLIAVLVVLHSAARVSATTLDGSTGLVRVPYATTLGKGKLLVNSQAANTIQKGASVVSWYYAGMSQFGTIYGMNRMWDVWLTYRGYQDNVAKEDMGWGGNFKLGTKYNFYNNRRLRYNLAGEMIVIAPTGKWANIPWEPFSSGQLELQLSLLGSYSKYYHGMFGYIFHNDADIAFGQTQDSYNGNQPGDVRGQSATHELLFGIGGEYPIVKDILIMSGELTNRYIVNPKKNIYSSEPWTILTTAVKYFLNNNLYFSGAFDLRLTGGTNDTKIFTPAVDRNGVVLGTFWGEADNYPLWRLHLDVNWLAYQRYRVIQGERGEGAGSGGSFSIDEPVKEDTGYLDLLNDFGEVGTSVELQEKMKLYKQLKMEQKETQEAEKELDEIRMKRKEAESELQKLRSLLEELD